MLSANSHSRMAAQGRSRTRAHYAKGSTEDSLLRHAARPTPYYYGGVFVGNQPSMVAEIRSMADSLYDHASQFLPARLHK